jgi:hypothetical protein
MSTDDRRLPAIDYAWAEFVDDDPGPASATTAPNADRPGNQDRNSPQPSRAAHAISTALRTAAGHTLPGLRHAVAVLGHWTALRYISDEEIRRRLVKRHLDAYVAQRDDTRHDLERLGNKVRRLSRDAADFGLTVEERRSLVDVSRNLQHRRNAGAALARIPFDAVAVQPTRAQIRRARSLRAAGRFVGVILPASVAAVGLVVSLPLSGLLALPVLAAGAWWLGRHPITLAERPIPADLMASELAPPALDASEADAEDLAELAPYPLAQATTADEAAEALRRAIVHEGGDVAEVTQATREPWGWSAYVRFATGSPDDLNKEDTYKGIITLLKIRRNGLLIEGDPDAGDACTVRMLQRDPFTPELVGPVPYRPPLSASITDLADVGVGMDASSLEFALAGLMLLMVADSGGAKSGVMLALAEAATATRDAVVVNLDPVGTGIGDLGGAITLDATMDDDLICAVLEFFLRLCSARARQRARYGWGNKWRVSDQHPAFCLFLDEWPQLSDKAKNLWIRYLLLGRKEALWGYGASQFGTKDHLGEAIGPKLSGKLLGACRRVDVTELLGAGALAEGYRADLIRPATHTAINDAGQIYGVGLPGMPNRPIRYKIREITANYAARVGAERCTAGLPDVTHTLQEAGLLADWHRLLARCAEASGATPASHGTEQPQAPDILLRLRAAFTAEGDPAWLTLHQIHATHLRASDPGLWGRWDGQPDRDRLREVGKALSRMLREAGADLPSTRIVELDDRPRGYYLTALEDAVQAAQTSTGDA